MSSSIKRSLSETTEGSSSPTQQPTKSKTRDTANAKARLPLDAKVIIAEHIVAKGIAVVDVAELELATGLTKQQIKKRLLANRSNVRKQLEELVKTMA